MASSTTSRPIPLSLYNWSLCKLSDITEKKILKSTNISIIKLIEHIPTNKKFILKSISRLLLTKNINLSKHILNEKNIYIEQYDDNTILQYMDIFTKNNININISSLLSLSNKMMIKYQK